MNKSTIVEIKYITDVLCIWAYLAQIRINELKIKFGSNIDLHYHFIPVFGSVESKIKPGIYGGVGANFLFINWFGVHCDIKYHLINFDNDHPFSGFDLGMGIGFYW